MWPHESISTLGKFSTSLRGREVKITSGLETGDKDRARKHMAHTSRSKHIQMLAVSQHDFVEVIKDVCKEICDQNLWKIDT